MRRLTCGQHGQAGAGVRQGLRGPREVYVVFLRR